MDRFRNAGLLQTEAYEAIKTRMTSYNRACHEYKRQTERNKQASGKSANQSRRNSIKKQTLMCVTTRIASLNLCLGLRNKKDAVKKLIIDNDIKMLCLQEAEVTLNFPINLLTFKGFNYESETNFIKSRCGIYVSNNISYLRCNYLEVVTIHLVISDIIGEKVLVKKLKPLTRKSIF